MSLDTLANVKARLGVSTSADDTLLGLLQNSADQFIGSYCDRDFVGGTYTEYHPGGSAFVHLRNYPVASVTSVNVDPSYVFGSETVLPATSYVIHLERGVIQSLLGAFLPEWHLPGLLNTDLHFWPRGPRVVQVVYSVATGQVPGEVLEAYARLIGHWYRRVKTEVAQNFQNLTRQKYGDSLAVYADPATLGGVPGEVRDLLAAYRLPAL